MLTALIIGICLIIQGQKHNDTEDITVGTIVTVVCGGVLLALAAAALMVFK